MDFIFPSQYSSPKLQLQFLLNYVSIYISSKSVSQIFKIIIQTGDINIFVHNSVISVLQFQIKTSFSSEKNTGDGI